MPNVFGWKDVSMQDLIYLDNAATSFPKPEAVHEATHRFYARCGVNPGRTGCDLGLEAEAMIQGTREKLSAFFNPSLAAAGKEKDPDRLVFTLNATMALNLIINGTVEAGIERRAGDRRLDTEAPGMPVSWHDPCRGASQSVPGPPGENNRGGLRSHVFGCGRGGFLSPRVLLTNGSMPSAQMR